MPVRELVQQVGRRLADALPQAVGGGPQPPGPHLRGDLFGFAQRGFPAFHGEYRLQGGGRPFPVDRRDLGEHVAHEMHHAALVLRLGQYRADRGHQSGAPVADHEPDALQVAFDHAADELLPAGRVLPHALRDADDLAMPLRVDSDGDQDAHVLHVPPHERLCHTPSTNTYGYSDSNGLVRHWSISP